LLWRAEAVGVAAGNERKQATWTHYWIEEAARRNSIARLQPVDDHSFHAEVLGQWPHDMVKSLTYKYDFRARIQRFFQAPNPFWPQLRFEFVLEILVTEQV
jgi:hypothetical protein